MLENAQIMASIAVSNLEKAIDFYQNTLGLSPTERSKKQGELIMQTNEGSMVVLHEPLRSVSEHTIAAFVVDDLESTVEELRQAGVKFEDYDLPGLKTVNSIATSPTGKCAWFKDPDGNILAINQRSG